MQGKTGLVMEMVQFQCLPGISAGDLAAAAAEGQGWLAHQPGLISRSLCQSGRAYIDIVLWSDLDAAQEAASRVMTEPSFARFMAMIDASTVRMEHLPLVVCIP